ncbi:MAG: N-methylhydantoinase A, partial [Candidatus Paceibacteria bacterium]
ELAPLDEEAVRDFALMAQNHGYESVAIGFLHSYVNDTHERRAREIINAQAPKLNVSISAEVSPQMREFERFNTVCANAFVKPLMASYLNRLVDRLKEIGVDCPVFMIHSGGGLISIGTAAEFPVRLLESGPAGGAIYAADVAARHGLSQILSYDMGGTTAKICLVENFTPKTARSFEVARTYRFKKGSGMPISIPVIEMVEIGAGGGSLAHVDGMRQIRVGPESAGSEPGPACFGQGGLSPAVTDADLVLGKLDPDNFAGGEIKLSLEASNAALSATVGDVLQMEPQKAAVGVIEVVDESMAAAARVHAVENGKELGDFTMIAYGGAAPLHANRLCEKLGITTLLIPPGAGVGAAIGFLRAPFGYEAVRGAYMRLSQYNTAWVNEVLDGLESESVAVARQGDPAGKLTIERKAYMRYVGQGWEIPVILSNGSLTDTGDAKLRHLFEAEYERLFGAPLEGLDVEVMNWSVKASSQVATVNKVAAAAVGSPAPVADTRPIFDARSSMFLDSAIVNRTDMAVGATVTGPAAIVEDETTTIVTAGFDAILQTDGCLLLQKKETAK